MKISIKIMALLLTVCMILPLVASCGNGGGAATQTTSASNEQDGEHDDGAQDGTEGEGTKETSGTTDTTPTHTCEYTQRKVEDKYLKAAATCTSKAEYFYSCECGKAGTQAFEHGECLPHTFDQKVATKQYEKTPETYTEGAVYYYSCACGEKGTETFTVPTSHVHTYDKQVATNEYLKTPETYTTGAVYYKSCICGANGTETFTVPTSHVHAYNQTVAEQSHIKTPATCTDKAVYYKSCICGANGTETFEHGSSLGHSFTNYVSNNNATYESDGTETAVCNRENCNVTDTRTDEGSMLIQNSIVFKTLNLKSGNNVYGKVANGTSTFSFLNEVEIRGAATYGVYRDIYCSQEVKSKTVPLVTGDNTFYIWAENTDSGNILYTITVRVKPMYDVTFNTLGGTAVEKQIVEEDALAIEPTTTKSGYTFESWDFDFATPITGETTISAIWTANKYAVTFDKNGGAGGSDGVNATSGADMPTATAPQRVGYTFLGYYDIADNQYYNASMASVKAWDKPEATILYAKWTANTDTKYTVNHYQQNIENDEYTWFETDNLTGTSDTSVTPSVKTYTGFTAPTAKTETIAPDGSLVIDYYYTRNNYTITFDKNGGTGGSESVTVKFNASMPTATAPSMVGYTFDGYYDSSNVKYYDASMTSVKIWDKSMTATLYAKWIENTDTKYTVNHYQQNIENDEYTLFEADNLTGTSDTSVTPSVKTYTGFTSPTTKTETIAPDGSLVVDYYYTRNSYTVTVVGNGGTSKKITQKYQSAIDTTAWTARDCYELGGFYTDINLSVSYTDTTMPAKNVTVYAYWIGENKPTDFTYTTNASRVTITDYIGSETVVNIPLQIGGENVIELSHNVFKDCNSITSVTIGSSVTSIGEDVFCGCTRLTEINFNATAMDDLSSNNFVFAYAGQNGRGITVNIGANVTKIPAYLFCPYYSSCTPWITSIVFAENSQCKSIGTSAFSGCKSLESITIPDSVTSIGSNAFYGCTGLESITVLEGNTKYKSDGNCLIEIASNTLVLGCKNSTIPDRVTSIGSYAFSDCTRLTSITIPDSVTSIGSYAFSGCTRLTSITILDSVTSIGSYAFSGCTRLTSITIPDSVTSIGRYAFYNCTALTEINFNATAMDDLSSKNYVFAYAGYNGTGITVNIGANVTKIPEYLFCPYSSSISYAPKITSVVFAENSQCESIGSSAFEYCTSLESVTIGNSVTSIGSSAFCDCTNLTEINFNATAMNDLSEGVFCHAGQSGTGITVNIGANVTKIPAYLFCSYDADYAPKITSVVFDENSQCESIGKCAFRYCTSLTSITIPSSVTSIGFDAFYNCTNLTSITFEDTSTWYTTQSSLNWSYQINGTETDVTNASTNATYFKYALYSYWYKK